ncbi:MAG: 2-oxo acid dehydrogenase subunit E2 [Candidatus Abyssobacteria bacterium SURF_5]|uniref:Dihydrolipoamide acetyltransferase component of pyruvate dehydrogenase complex n=1 Tax=Abyssobacteria bacterium (strain SURF_5) TaxID=2093360 RepID=A0A3A4NS03_ABYX5|nr:MAG: 2-oxo acid dehydrogenase subunit E2 [Candidatus Abyssubacteria bacterium SURF_5]
MATEFKFPDVGEGITEGEIVLWLVDEGERVEQDQLMVQVETDKAVVEIPSPRAGTILKILYREGEIIKVGETLVIIGEEGEKPPEPEKKEEEKREYVGIVGDVGKAAPKAAAGPRVLAVPAVRKLAKDLGVDINKVKGTGPDGRISEDDVKRHAEQAPVSADEDTYGEIERIPIMRVRRSVAQKMVRSATSIPHVTHTDIANATQLVLLKRQKAGEASSRKINLTYLPFIMKAAALSLLKHPYLNSSVDSERNEILLKKYINIGFAVETDDGLLVPVVKNVDKKSIIELAEETQRLADLTWQRKVALADLKGGTFSITNIGSIGGIYSTPIINHPEAANLGLGKIRELPWVVNGEVKVISGIHLSLSFDHRILDGAEAARFLNDVIAHIEDPGQLV